MTYEEKVEWLNRYRYKLMEINDILDRIVRFTAQAERMTANISAAGGTGGAGGDNLQICVAAICELEEKQSAKMAESMQELLEIEDAIDALPKELWRVILRKKYIDGVSLNKMVDMLPELKYSVKQIKREHQRAINALKM